MNRARRVVAVLEHGGDEQVVAGAGVLAALLHAVPAELRPSRATATRDDRAEHDLTADQVLAVLASEDVVGATLGTHGRAPVLWDVIEGARVPLLVIPGRASGTVQPIHRILLPLDGSSATTDAVEPFTRAAQDAGVDVMALHVFDATTAPAFWDHPSHAHRSWRDEFLRRHRLGDIPLDVRRGDAEAEVLLAADRSGADAILLGWGQELGAGHALLVRSVLLTASVPVLLVGPVPGPTPAGNRDLPPS